VKNCEKPEAIVEIGRDTKRFVQFLRAEHRSQTHTRRMSLTLDALREGHFGGHRAPQKGRRSTMSTMSKADYSEGSVARAIEDKTARLPSDAFLWSAVGCIAGAFALHFIFGRKQDGVYVGLWVPTLLILGTYNKLVKQQGHDMNSSPNRGY
jgi:hypothetical protein